MRNNFKLFIDFDETLFDHYAFAGWIEELLHQKGELKDGVGSLMASIDKYHDVKQELPLLRLYMHKKHYDDITKTGWDKLSKFLQKHIIESDLEFSYDDAPKFIRWVKETFPDSIILTYGDEEYQLFKISSCNMSGISKLKVKVISEPKNVYLEREYSDTKGVLIDDKYPLKLPHNWWHIWIDRKNETTAPELIDKQVVKISNLDQVPEAFDLINN